MSDQYDWSRQWNPPMTDPDESQETSFPIQNDPAATGWTGFDEPAYTVPQPGLTTDANRQSMPIFTQYDQTMSTWTPSHNGLEYYDSGQPSFGASLAAEPSGVGVQQPFGSQMTLDPNCQPTYFAPPFDANDLSADPNSLHATAYPGFDFTLGQNTDWSNIGASGTGGHGVADLNQMQWTLSESDHDQVFDPSMTGTQTNTIPRQDDTSQSSMTNYRPHRVSHLGPADLQFVALEPDRAQVLRPVTGPGWYNPNRHLSDDAQQRLRTLASGPSRSTNTQDAFWTRYKKFRNELEPGPREGWTTSKIYFGPTDNWLLSNLDTGIADIVDKDRVQATEDGGITILQAKPCSSWPVNPSHPEPETDFETHGNPTSGPSESDAQPILVHSYDNKGLWTGVTAIDGLSKLSSMEGKFTPVIRPAKACYSTAEARVLSSLQHL
ncbi:hypothetical protein IAU59_003082 [Kwoniella sp. CBS 9459]